MRRTSRTAPCVYQLRQIQRTYRDRHRRTNRARAASNETQAKRASPERKRYRREKRDRGRERKLMNFVAGFSTRVHLVRKPARYIYAYTFHAHRHFFI